MTAEQLEKVRWLNRAFHAEKAAKAWLAKLERDRSDVHRLKSLNHGGGGAAYDIEGTERKVRECLQELAQVRTEITAAIMAVDVPELQAILVRHYLVYEPLEMVSENMYYHLRTVQRKHKDALDKVVIPKNKKVLDILFEI